MNTPKSTTDAGRIAFLDYLRVFAFTSVLIGHKFYPQLVAVAADESYHVTPRFVLELLLPLFNGGGAGVLVFFLVSGYIIAHVVQTERLGEYAVKRFFRIYPLFVFAILIEHATTTRPHPPRSAWEWVLQLLLLGDFAQMPGGLGGVEWTLRVEVAFYVYMGALKALGLLGAANRALPAVLLVSVLALGATPFPVHEFSMLKGYLIYAPFLLLGVGFSLRETGDLSGTLVLVLALLVFHQHYAMIARHQRPYMTAHFGGLAFLMFAICWAFRRYITATPLVLALSELTYGVYLFHDWGYELIRDQFAAAGVSLLRPEVQGLIGLFAVCAAANRFVEKPAARFARTLTKRHQAPVRLALRRLPVRLNLSRPVDRL